MCEAADEPNPIGQTNPNRRNLRRPSSFTNSYTTASWHPSPHKTKSLSRRSLLGTSLESIKSSFKQRDEITSSASVGRALMSHRTQGLQENEDDEAGAQYEMYPAPDGKRLPESDVA